MDRTTYQRAVHRYRSMSLGRVLVAMSGGVDSSVAAALLVERGYEVIGVTMKLFCYGDEMPERACCSVESVRDAEAVAHDLGIPHYVRDFETEFSQDVIENFVSEYVRGRTPIPCVRCNSFTKFRDLVAFADSLGCHHLATGHYAIANSGALYRGVDPIKDQSYFLWGISSAVIERLLLPIGELNKSETRKLARQLKLASAERPESVEVCFVPNDDYVAVLERHIGPDSLALRPGPVITTDGEVVGEHNGYARYTVGQRRGLPGGFPRPMYVTAIRPQDRTVVIGPADSLLGDRLVVEDVNWIGPSLGPGDRCSVAIRYRSPAAPAELYGDVTLSEREVGIRFDDPVRGITPGQSAVMYADDGRLLGGGVIKKAT